TRVKDEFSEYEHFLYGTYGKAAERLLFDLDHMLVGQTPPDLEGTDVSGKPVKLSDYRGKLLIVDFWQGSDPATHDHHGLKHILEKAGDRVAVVGIVSDSKEEVLQVVEKYNLTYPVFADGNRGPLFTQWNIHTWPTTFLLDDQGKILHRGQRGTTLEKILVEKLVAE
ncbi:MAG TPA: TlpA disulfide reductase family protein, partial [Planctomycetaceae bacterium]|nr:TlpA disulfide reductase family protein [Planctomycetaceae bacterium]